MVFLFLISGPGQGGTMLYKTLNKSKNISTFLDKIYSKNGKNVFIVEGQTLIMHHDSNFLKSIQNKQFYDYNIDVTLIDNIYSLHWDLDKKVLCDKSTRFMFYAENIFNHFQKIDKTKFIGLIRNPYAVNCEAEVWISYAYKLKENKTILKDNLLVLFYEEFVSETENVKQKILKFIPELESFDNSSEKLSAFAGSDKRQNVLTDKYRDRKLNVEQKNVILKNHILLLNYFGYQLSHT